MNQLLTDDEIVALAVNVGTGWPLSLPTIPTTDVNDLAASNNRGLRSLAVRGLTQSAEGESRGVAISADLVELATAAIASRRLLVAYVADLDHPLVPSGSSMCVYFGDGDDTVVDSVTVSGVHALRHEPASDGIALITTFASNVYRDGVAGVAPDARMGVVVTRVGDGLAPEAILIAKGSVTSGVLDVSGEPEASFVESATTDVWDPELVRRLA